MEVTRFPPPLFLDVQDRSHVGEARRRVIAYAANSGFGETPSATLGLIMTELTNNLVRYATGAEIVVQGLTTFGGDSIEILSIDRGPGMSDIGSCLRDGFTTGGTPGNGLGAIKRLSDEFDIFSTMAKGISGSVIVSRVLRDEQSSSPGHWALSWGAYSRPIDGETVCGDNWRVDCRAEHCRFMVSDGLGHGPSAAQAAQNIAETFEQEPSLPPMQFLTAAHHRATGTRGAAVAIARVELPGRRVRYAGIGNISGLMVEGELTRGLISQNGTVGVVMRKPLEMEYTWPRSGILVMHSDGIMSRWSLANYPGLQLRHPSIIAAVLARDFSRGRDDRTVLVARFEGNDCD